MPKQLILTLDSDVFKTVFETNPDIITPNTITGNLGESTGITQNAINQQIYTESKLIDFAVIENTDTIPSNLRDTGICFQKLPDQG